MIDKKNFDVIIIGGSYAGLSAAMSLGRALRNILIIDSGKPCNAQTPHSHNFITQDGKTPKEISTLAKQQVEQYDTVTFLNDLVVDGSKTNNGFEIKTQSGETVYAKKLVFASGVKDLMPAIPGFSECWGISVIHCPYCHGYEVKNEATGILNNGEMGFELSKLISNWTKELTLFTNGKSTITPEQSEKLAKHSITIVEKEIERFEHEHGYLRQIVFKDGSATPVKAVYARPLFQQHCDLPEKLGCELTEQGYLKVDMMQKTSNPGIYACGDSTVMMRSVASAVYTGNMAGAALNKELIEESF